MRYEGWTEEGGMEVRGADRAVVVLAVEETGRHDDWSFGSLADKVSAGS